MELRRAERYIEKRKLLRRRGQALLGMAAAVVLCTVYALMRPAVTLERETTVCGLEEHVHTESCCETFCDSTCDTICDKEEHAHVEKCYKKTLTMEPEDAEPSEAPADPGPSGQEAPADEAAELSEVLEMQGASATESAAVPLALGAARSVGEDMGTVLEVDALNVWDTDADMILVYPGKFNDTGKTISTENPISLGKCFGTDTDFSAYSVLRIEKRGGRYQIVQAEETAEADTAVICGDAYLLLAKKEVYPTLPYLVTTDDPDGDGTEDGGGDSVQFNLLWGNTAEKSPESGNVYAYVTVFPKKYDAVPGTAGSMSAKADDISVVENDPAIRFRLFNYDGNINYTDRTRQTQRALTPYFVFKGTYTGGYAASQGPYDADGFPRNHATVERTLQDGYPVLDINRAADGGKKGTEVDLTKEQRSLKYLFDETASDHAVTAYAPKNTLLEKDGSRYHYASGEHAVDYDTENDLFRVRSYRERNSLTAKYGAYWDFLPFNYTDGVVSGTVNGSSGSPGDGKTGLPYNLRVDQVDYWFGMRMDVDFFQPYDGKLGAEEMTFTFAGDDDVWVFVDDVLVLDLGGTHGEVTGTINFATGEIAQHLTWLGASAPSWPTTLKACFEAAGRVPSGGWKGGTFADYSKHTLSFFYLERGASVANCKIDFNLYTLPDKELSVAKVLVSDDANADAGTLDHLADTMEYRFQVLKADSEGKASGDLLAGPGTPYTLITPGKADRRMTVGTDGCFLLRSGQRAVFANTMGLFAGADLPKEYVVRELIPTSQNGQYKDVVYTLGDVDGQITEDIDTSAAESTGFTGYDSDALEAAKGNLVVFRNRVDTEKMGTLQVTKTAAGAKPLAEETYWFRILAGPAAADLTALPAGTAYTVTTAADRVGTGRTAGENGLFALKEGETLSLRLLTGTYFRVEEVHADGTQLNETDLFRVTYTGSDAGQFDTQGKTITVTAGNTYDPGSLKLTKRVNNTYTAADTGGEFTFRLAIQNVPAGWAGRSFPVTFATAVSGRTHADGTVVFSGDGTAELKLYHGETATVKDLPLALRVQITEQNTEGWSVSWENGGAAVPGTAQQTVTLSRDAPDAALICVNTTGYELPSTGGPGTGLFYGFGGLLTLGAMALFSARRHGGRRRDAF